MSSRSFLRQLLAQGRLTARAGSSSVRAASLYLVGALFNSRSAYVILHIIIWALLSGAAAGAVYYCLRWNDSDERWLHRMGECTHSKRFCG